MKTEKSMDEKMIGKRMILNALQIEENLAGLLRSEIKVLRKRTFAGAGTEDIQKINKMIKYILFSFTLMDDRIKTGIDLMNNISSNKNETDIK